MKIVVLGLGYLGSTVAGCALADGHHVIGVDTDERRVSMVANGVPPVREPELQLLFDRGLAEGRLCAQTTLGETLDDANLAIVCVGTPSGPAGALDLSQVVSATRAIGAALRSRPTSRRPLCIVYRSTLSPGTMDDLVLPLLRETTGAEPGMLYEPCYNPESLREGSAVSDYRRPSRVVVGERIPGAAHELLALYDSIDTKKFCVSFAAAELVKLADNSFHALKVAYANELGRYATHLGIDAQQFADIFVADDRLNISAAYLRPGGNFGGPCLAKDTTALVHTMIEQGIDAPLLSAILPSNETHHAYLYDEITRALTPGATILIHGLGFKAGSSDLRDSPAVSLALELIAAGFRVRVFDPDVSGVDDFHPKLPQLLAAVWLSDLQSAADGADGVVLCKKASNLQTKAIVFDISRLRLPRASEQIADDVRVTPASIAR